ncbi:hypothetical protein [Microbacterium sp. NIBRBAC000506063]|uniref:hypothetical protein n=1 Tax=Microbacterium sp. NIBRBAC000506063 TaxID=2734618 RepID=UPI001BB6F77A|nr:hypothetical protein [Microbacterium sp. NIBRBAC000506063]QTV79484.1 hypothetical protein KAE78_11310 [Microbacterium sp. NIBRBAC000506063]
MAGKMRIQINKPGVLALLNAPEVAADLTSRGNRMAAAAGDGFEVDTTSNRDRAVVFVRTATVDAMRAEAKDRSLTRSIDAGR